MNLRVECYAGYRGEETPRAFYLGKQRVAVKEVIDRWLAPDHRYFKVQAEDNSIYILRHETESNDWTGMLCRWDSAGANGADSNEIPILWTKQFRRKSAH